MNSHTRSTGQCNAAVAANARGTAKEKSMSTVVSLSPPAVSHIDAKLIALSKEFDVTFSEYEVLRDKLDAQHHLVHEILAICHISGDDVGRLDNFDRAFDGVLKKLGFSDDYDSIYDPVDAVVDQMLEIRATSVDGLKAKAYVAAALSAEIDIGVANVGKLAESIVRDLAAMNGDQNAKRTNKVA